MDENRYNYLLNDKIEKAMREGQFNDLPGKGKPIDWSDWDNPFAPADEQLAHHLLKNAGYAPGWVQDRREIVAELEGARASLNRTWEWVLRNGGSRNSLAALNWDRAQKVFRSAADDLNKRIRNHNLTLPDSSIALHLIDVDAEIMAVRTGQKIE